MSKTKLKGRPLSGAQKIALERMWRLIELAKDEWEHDEAGSEAFVEHATQGQLKSNWVPKGVRRSRRYIQLIRNFSTRFRIPIPREIRNQFCKKCGNYWRMGETVTRRVKGNTINYNCKICGTLTRRKMQD